MDTSDEEDVLVACCAAVVVAHEDEKQQDRRSGRVWEGSITESRRREGAYYTTVQRLIIENTSDLESVLPAGRVGTFRNYFRLSKAQFEFLLAKVDPYIRKEDTHYRDSISSEERLMVTLRYLATGSSMTALHYDWCISVAALSAIIPETCRAIYESLKSVYLTTPNTVEEWVAISTQLEENWNFPNALGSLDGKHIVMTKPFHAGSEYHNYKGTESIVLMAMCDSNYSFTYVDVGAQGRASDGGIYGACSLAQAIENKSINFPPPRIPPNFDVPLPYAMLGDEAFPLKNHLMRPYPRRSLNHERRIFNYRLSRTRRLIENAFGILAATWRILLRRIDLEPDKTQTLTLACCALHNLIRTGRTPPRGAPSQTVSENILHQHMIAGNNTLGDLPNAGLRPTAEASATRESFCRYFNTVGTVPWQDDMVMDEN